MAFLRRSGRQILVLHGERDPNGRVRQRRLLCFRNLEDLRKSLEAPAWERHQAEVAQRWPELQLDWERLEQDLRGLLESAPEPISHSAELQVERLQKQCRRTLEEIRRFPGVDSLQLRIVGYDLKEMLRAGAALFARLTPERDSSWLADLFSEEQAEALMDQAVTAFQRRLPERGSELFQRAREADPVDPDIDNSEGICWFELGDMERAEGLLCAARDLAHYRVPERAGSFSWSELSVRPYLRATYNLGLVRQQQERVGEAIELWRECLRLCPEDGVGARFILAPTLQRQGRLQEALVVYREHLGNDRVAVPDLYYDMVTALVLIDQISEAVYRLVEGIAINRFIPRVLLGARGETLPLNHRLGDPSSPQWALEYVRGSRDLWSSKASELLVRIWEDAQLQRQLGGLERAEEDLRRAAEDQKPLMIHRLFLARKRVASGRWRGELAQRMQGR